MAYTRFYDPALNNDPDTPVDADWANHVEEGIEATAVVADAAAPATAAILKSLIDAAGDLIQGSAADTVARLAIGANDEVLSVNGGILDYRKLVNAMCAFTFSSYTPTWSASGTAPAIGDGSLVGKYLQLGRLVIGFAAITFGSTTTNGTGNYRLSLPVTAGTATLGNMTVGFGRYTDNSTGNQYALMPYQESTTVFGARIVIGGTGLFSATAPVTPASGDQADFFLIYESA